jgi:hypothetical protein
VSIRFLADADLNRAIVSGALERDPDALEFAAREGRVLVSHDTSTMPVHFSDRLRSGGTSPGVFLVRQRASVGQVVEAILLVWSASAAGEWAGQIHYLPTLSPHDFRR